MLTAGRPWTFSGTDWIADGTRPIGNFRDADKAAFALSNFDCDFRLREPQDCAPTDLQSQLYRRRLDLIFFGVQSYHIGRGSLHNRLYFFPIKLRCGNETQGSRLKD